MKVCIITLQYTNNYGAVLQCYALQKMLEGLGHTVNVLDFSVLLKAGRQRIWQGWGLRSGLRFSAIKSKYLRVRYSNVVSDKFDFFRTRWLKLTGKVGSMADAKKVLSDYDAVIVGSDQVWNQSWFHSLYYLGEELLPITQRKISFSASAGSGTIPQERITNIKEWLGRFYAIGVRDEDTRRLLYNVLALKSEVTCDPTLMSDLSEIEINVKIPAGKYILVYFLHQSSAQVARETIAYLAQELNMPVYAITTSAHEAFRPDGATSYLNDVGPSEWHALFRGAEFICTDSFHGSIFSAKFKKRFAACVPDPLKGSRLIDAAGRYGFKEAIIRDSRELIENFDKISSRNRDQCSYAITQHVNYSAAFLAKMLT